MRYRLMATYRGIGYEAGMGPTDTDIVLFASSAPAEELGFEPGAGQWRKRVRRDDLDLLWESKPVGRYRSQPCLVLDEIGDRLHITHLGHDAYQAERLGYWQVDRGVYEVVVPRDEVTELTEQQVEHPVGGRARGPEGTTPLQGGLGSDHAPSQNGAMPQELAPSANGQEDEQTSSAWLEDKLPPPRPLPKRRRPESRPSAPRIPDPQAPAVSATVLPLQPAADAAPAAAHAGPAGKPADVTEAAVAGQDAAPAPREQPSPAAGGRRRRARVETRWVFRELVDMAAIPHGSYAVDEEVDGALCLVKTDDGYEVFSPIDGAKHEVRFFEDEEAAYFYLFGVLAAEAIRGGKLVPKPD